MAGARSKNRGAKTARSRQRARLAELMRGIDYCMMATRGDRGTLHARPMSNNGEVEFDGDAWFFTSRESRKVGEIERDAHVVLSYVGGTKRAPIWISVTGTAEIVTDDEQKLALWIDELDQWFDDGPEDPDVVLVHVKAARAAWWSYDEQGEVAF